MAQHFRGYLAGLSLLSNKTEDNRVISCLNECQEKLEFTGVDTLDDTVNQSRLKPGFHYPSSRPKFTGRIDGP